MAIQMRRGSLADYDKNKMVAGEWGISTDEDTNDQKAFITFAPGVSKEVLFVEDAETQIAIATAAAIDEATEEAEAWAHGDGFSVNDYASGDGSTTSFILKETPTTIENVYIDGSVTHAYTVSGKTITFSTAPAYGQNNIRVVYTVNTSEDNAKYYKDLASQYATSASASSTNANTKANEASVSAELALGSEVAAGRSATAAAGSEANAESFAQSASDSAAAAAASAGQVDTVSLLGDFATFEPTTTSTRAYNVGDYLTYGGWLYRVTAAIAIGDTITEGTNVIKTTVGEEIKNKVLWWQSYQINSTGGSSGTLCTITDSRITANHVMTKFVAANSSVITDKITCTTSAGQAVITGKSTAATTAEIVLVRKDN